jgi:hypothetical protein
MIIRGCSLMLIMAGVMLFIMAKMSPLMTFLMMDWIGLFSIIGGIMIIYIAFPFSDSGMLYDTIPAGTAMIPFIRRDGIIIPVLGKRVFTGESFLDVPKLGLIEDLGAGTVLLWGRKKIRFGLENISYTPDMRYANLCATLRQLGFDDSDDLTAIMNIPSIKDEKERAYALSRMAEVYWKMTHMQPKGAERLLESFKRPLDTRVDFHKKTRWQALSRFSGPKTRVFEKKQDLPTENRLPQPKNRDIDEIDALIDKRMK